jgi:hypothetical protein
MILPWNLVSRHEQILTYFRFCSQTNLQILEDKVINVNNITVSGSPPPFENVPSPLLLQVRRDIHLRGAW